MHIVTPAFKTHWPHSNLFYSGEDDGAKSLSAGCEANQDSSTVFSSAKKL